jgi:hypothetical protein
MKKNLISLTLLVLLTGQLTSLQAQSLFLENFETSPVTSILNSAPLSETQLTTGPPPCAKASRGTTVDFNSVNVNFNNTQNSTYFLGANPEGPCNGYYMAALNTSSLNFSGQESLRFKCRYFKSSTLNWGPDSLRITFSDGVSKFVIDSLFSVTDNWTTIDVPLPNFLIAPAVTIKFKMGGGEGVGLDDIEIVNISSLGFDESSITNNIKFYPNPFSAQTTLHSDKILNNATLTVYNSLGQILSQLKNINGQTVNLNRNNLPIGHYFAEISEENKIIAIDKLVIMDK